MNILHIILKKSNTVSTATLTSVEKVFQTGDDLETDILFDGYEAQVKELIEKNYELYKAKGITHITLIPDGSLFTDNFRANVEQYIKGEDTVYLPMVQYLESTEGSDPAFKGLLNTCMWKPYAMSNQYGFVGEELAVKQIDTSLYGAVIPLEILKTYPFKTKIKHYSSFEFISRIVHKGVIVKGVPKVCVIHIADDTLKKIPQDEKVRYFTACQTLYKTDEDIEVLDANTVQPPTNTK